MIYHPKLNEHGNKEKINNPSKATPIATWSDPAAAATVIPDGEMPRELNGISFSHWSDAPRTNQGWEELADQHRVEEPPFLPPKHKKHAAGVIVEEADGRVWLVAPSNAHGGYSATFPKGTVDPGASRPATALKEAFEESGLRVEITGFFADSDRSQSYTRYYLARRLGGTPANMCWESQAVHLVPRTNLAKYLTNANDEPLLAKLLSRTTALTKDDIVKYEFGLTSGHRILEAVRGYRSRFGKWPTRLLMWDRMADAIQRDTLTDLGWAMLVSKMEVVRIPEGAVIVEGKSGNKFEYGEAYEPLPDAKSADMWIWGCILS